MKKHLHLTLIVSALAASLLSACGGGSDSAPAATTTVSGTAATGSAIAGGSISMNCVSGASATTTTATDGSFTLGVSGIVFPCVARVTASTGDKLHSYVAAAGTANITPVTELLLANLTGGTALDAFDKFDATKAKALTAAQVTAAIAAVKAYLVTLGVSVIDFPADPMGTKFVAGDKADAVLDDLAAKLKAVGKKLSDAVTDIAKGGGSGTASGGAGCTGDALAFFTKKKGSYPSTADLRGSISTVAGFKEGATVTVVVNENCTVSLGATTLTFKDGTYEKFSDGQVNVVVTAPGFTTFSTYEVFANGAGLLSLGDTKTGAFANFFMK
ncbi:MAG: hypothetical protein H7197_07600 [Vitreoscilla sp.]|nr:hypothetical protein [Polaromonas sp.]